MNQYAFEFYAVVLPGLEKLAAQELTELAAHEIVVGHGGIAFSGSMELMYRVNLRARCITRVLLRLKAFKALSIPELYGKAGRIDWSRYIAKNTRIQVHAQSHQSLLIHSGRIEQAVLDAIVDQRSLGEADESAPEQQIMVRMEDNSCTISLDTSGERLDRRGYRLEPGKAPLRETLAAATLRWMNWHLETPLLVPMCGSGTIAIEAAQMALKIAGGEGRTFAFQRWPAFREKTWKKARQKAEAMRVSDQMPSIEASDLLGSAVEICQRNAERAGVQSCVQIKEEDVFALRPSAHEKPGLIVLNPPYGERIHDQPPVKLYQQLGTWLKQHATGWQIAVFCAEDAHIKALGLAVHRRLRITHGGKRMYIVDVSLDR